MYSVGISIKTVLPDRTDARGTRATGVRAKSKPSKPAFSTIAHTGATHPAPTRPAQCVRLPTKLTAVVVVAVGNVVRGWLCASRGHHNLAWSAEEDKRRREAQQGEKRERRGGVHSINCVGEGFKASMCCRRGVELSAPKPPTYSEGTQADAAIPG